jgi:fucose permease
MNQMNAIAIVGGALGTVVIGAIATEFRDQWRLGLLLTLPVIFYLFFVRDKDYEKHVPPEHGRQSGKTSIKMKFSILAFYISIACEFGISFWAAALLADRVGSSAALSTLSVFTFAVGSATGRWYISRLIHHMHIDSQLKLSFSFELVAFMLFWFSHNIALSIFALFALGIGLSIQFTVFSVRAIALSDGRPDLAVGYNALAAGTAIATSPFILGLLGDSYGISRAYLLIPALLILGIIIISLFPVKESATK